MDYENELFDVVVDKGTLDAMACHDDEKIALRRGRRYVSECFRVLAPGGVLLVASFGQPETRLKYFEGHDTAEPWCALERETLRASKRRGDKVFIYVLRKKPRTVHPACVGLSVFLALAASAALALRLAYASEAALALARDGVDLEPTPDAAQCNYELLKSFAALAGTARWTLGAGTLLGALRTEPPGLLPWEHDVDVYVPARDASDLIFKVAVDCAHGRREPHCGALEFRGFVDETWWTPCCGFGYKLFHATRDACSLDVLVLAKSTYAPWAHGETPNWPPLSQKLAAAKDALAALDNRADPPTFLVIPEDVHWKNLLFDPGRWTRTPGSDWAWPGPHVSYFQDEYFEASEFEPFRSLRLYDIDVNIPNDPWASLNRTYGPECAYMARVDEHGGVLADLRKPEHARLKRPAAIRVRDVTGIGLTDEERRELRRDA